MAGNLARYSASKEGQAADATWNTVVDCQEAVFFQERIYGPEDVIAFIYLPHAGWHQLGHAARAFRYRHVPRNPDPPPQTRDR